jgi:outer membrane lipoprotein LolB
VTLAGVAGAAERWPRGPAGSKALAAIAAAAFLAGCAVPVPAPESIGGNVLSGRLSVQVDAAASTPARSLSAAFELRGDPVVGRLDLSTPLGSVLAQARWSPQHVVLKTPRGETEFADLDALTREALGESLPVAALFDWLQGRPWPGAPSRAGNPPGDDFEQLGWTVNLARFDDALVSARRDAPPPVTVRIKLDRP